MSHVELAQLVSFYNVLHTQVVIELAAFALFIYDYILSFSLEVKCIWQRRFSKATSLYVLNRYAVMSNRIVLLIELKSWRGVDVQHADHRSYSCLIAWSWSQVATSLMYLSIAGFSALRTYAILRGNKRIFLLLVALGIIGPVSITYYNATLSFRATTPPFTGCVEDGTPRTTWNNFFFVFGTICTVVLETAALFLVWRKTAGNLAILRAFNASTKTSYTALLWRDGTIYSATLVILTAFALMSVFDSHSLQGVKNLPALTDTLLSICLSRFVLHLRSVELSEDLSTQSLHLSHIPDLHLTRPNIVPITRGIGLSSNREADGLSRLPVEGVQDA